MSGLLGLLCRDGGRLESGSQAFGPHGAASLELASGSFYSDGLAVLASTSFGNLLDTGHDAQPVLGGDGRYALVFDGRIDNRDELIEALGIRGVELQRMADAELVMRCWERWQDRLPERLIGDFAIVVWDKLRQSLFAARDHLGMRPLNYVAAVDRFAIASSPQMLFAFGYATREVDVEKLADVLVENYSEAGRSFFKSIARLPPAHRLFADRRGLRIERYWSPDPARRTRLGSDQAYVEAAKELLDRAVKCRMRGAGRIAAEISSGLDSPAVALATLKHLSGQARLPVYTIVPSTAWRDGSGERNEGDEGPLVRQIAAMHPRLEAHFIGLDGVSSDHGLYDRLRGTAALPRSPIAAAMWDGMHGEARAAGIQTMMSGLGGNLSLSWAGGGAYSALLRSGRFMRLKAELDAVSDGVIAWWRRFFGLAVLPIAPASLQRLYARLRPGDAAEFGDWKSIALINPELAAQCDVEGKALASGWSFGAHRWDRRQVRFDHLFNDTLFELGDYQFGTEISYGIQKRFPLLDIRLVEWCLAIPEEQYLGDGQARWLMKRLLQGQLPDAMLQNRPLSTQIADWHMRMSQDLLRLREEFNVMASDYDVSQVLNVGRIKQLLDAWPDKAPGEKELLGFQLQMLLPHALMVARFIRHVKGANL